MAEPCAEQFGGGVKLSTTKVKTLIGFWIRFSPDPTPVTGYEELSRRMYMCENAALPQPLDIDDGSRPCMYDGDG